MIQDLLLSVRNAITGGASDAGIGRIVVPVILIAVFIAMCLFPAWFGPIAYAYAALCALTVIQRSALAVAMFKD